MINIVRPPESPASLETQEIKDYLDYLMAWKSEQLLPENERTLAKPKPNASYRNSDLIEAFDDCFFAKCYLTEQQFFSSYEMDVEHFLSKNFDEHPELRYEWTNLYPADHDANMLKPRTTPVGGYLDPCDSNDDVENDLFYWLDFGGKKCHFKPINSTNIKAINTANLLDKIHNGHDKASKLKTGGLRQALFDRRDAVNKAVIAWLKAKANGNPQEEMRQEILIRRFLSRKASFTMLMRSTSVVIENVPPEFFD
jgi:hypothetical protein